MGATKITAIKRLISASSYTLITQRSSGKQAGSIVVSNGDIKDLILLSRSMKQEYDLLMESINQMAADTGSLHTLKEIRDALDVMEKL